MSYRTSRSFERQPNEIGFLIWASDTAARNHLIRNSHENPEVYALGWKRGVQSVSRLFRYLAAP